MRLSSHCEPGDLCCLTACMLPSSPVHLGTAPIDTKRPATFGPTAMPVAVGWWRLGCRLLRAAYDLMARLRSAWLLGRSSPCEPGDLCTLTGSMFPCSSVYLRKTPVDIKRPATFGPTAMPVAVGWWRLGCCLLRAVCDLMPRLRSARLMGRSSSCEPGDLCTLTGSMFPCSSVYLRKTPVDTKRPAACEPTAMPVADGWRRLGCRVPRCFTLLTSISSQSGVHESLHGGIGDIILAADCAGHHCFGSRMFVVAGNVCHRCRGLGLAPSADEDGLLSARFHKGYLLQFQGLVFRARNYIRFGALQFVRMPRSVPLAIITGCSRHRHGLVGALDNVSHIGLLQVLRRVETSAACNCIYSRGQVVDNVIKIFRPPRSRGAGRYRRAGTPAGGVATAWIGALLIAKSARTISVCHTLAPAPPARQFCALSRAGRPERGWKGTREVCLAALVTATRAGVGRLRGSLHHLSLI